VGIDRHLVPKIITQLKVLFDFIYAKYS
jgi:hypothetical protein